MKKIILLYLILIILLCINVSLAQDISINPNQIDPNNSKEIDPNQSNKYHKVCWFVNKKKLATMWLDENDKPVKSINETSWEDEVKKMYNDNKEILMEVYNDKGALISVRIPVKSTTHSVLIRPLIPVVIDQRFRNLSTTCSGVNRPHAGAKRRYFFDYL